MEHYWEFARVLRRLSAEIKDDDVRANLESHAERYQARGDQLESELIQQHLTH